MEFNYFLPVNIIFGFDKVNLVGQEAKKYGKKALLVTGKNSAKKTGTLNLVLNSLNKFGVQVVVYDEVLINPLISTVNSGTNIVKKENCDIIIGLGGGSAMDVAKGIAFCSQNDGDLSNYIYNSISGNLALPIILIPTTCGSGSEANSFAVFTNQENNDKKSLFSNLIVPKVSIVDPRLMMSMPRDIFTSVSFDALCHSIEAYLSKKSQPLTNIMALEAIRLLGENITRIYDDYSDEFAWEKVVFASTLGGMVINTAGVTAIHAMEHPLSGLKNIIHGQGLAALIIAIFEETILYQKDKFNKISSLLGGNNYLDCVDRVQYLLNKINLNVNLRKLGFENEDIDWLVRNCLKVSTSGIANHPVAFDSKTIKKIYEKSL